MSFSEYQEVYTELLYNDQLRESWHKGDFSAKNLSIEEEAALKNFPPDRMELVSNGTVNGRIVIFTGFLPKSIFYFINDDLLKNLGKEYCLKFPEREIFPRHHQVPVFLKYIRDELKKKSDFPEHLDDLFNFEICKNSLQYYQLPFDKKVSRAPSMASWASLFIAGPHFKTILSCIESNSPLIDYPDKPKHGYLLIREQGDTDIEKLHWTVYELLRRVNGRDSWAEIVDIFLDEEPELREQRAVLMDWEEHFFERGILEKDIRLD